MAAERTSHRRGSATTSPVGLQEMPFDWESHATSHVGCVNCRWSTTRDADRSAGFVVGLRLRRPFLAAATTRTHVRFVWVGSALADVVRLNLLAKVSKWHITVVTCHPRSQYSSEFRGGLFQALCSSFCTRPTSFEWWRFTASSCISTLTTVKSTPVRQSTMLRRRSTDFPAVLTTLKPGWTQADCD